MRAFLRNIRRLIRMRRETTEEVWHFHTTKLAYYVVDKIESVLEYVCRNRANNYMDRIRGSLSLLRHNLGEYTEYLRITYNHQISRHEQWEMRGMEV